MYRLSECSGSVAILVITQRNFGFSFLTPLKVSCAFKTGIADQPFGERLISRFPRMTHSFPRMTLSFPRMTHSFPRMTHSFPRMTHSFPRMTHSFPRMSRPFPRMTPSFPRMTHSFPIINRCNLSVELLFL
jgi:hypothetical protein